MPTPNCWNDAEHYDFDGITAALNRYLKLKTMPVHERPMGSDTINTFFYKSCLTP